MKSESEIISQMHMLRAFANSTMLECTKEERKELNAQADLLAWVLDSD